MIALGRLVGFVWVARHQSYAKAARAFPYPITQPGLFQQVRRLEEELGSTLFARASKDRMVLTVAGRVLFERCSPFLDELEETVDALRAGSAGVLRVEASALVLRQLIPEWLRSLRAKDASLEIRVTETNGPELNRLAEGKTDLIVDFFAGEMPRGVSSKVVANAQGYLIVPASSSRKKSLTLADMGDGEFIGYPPKTQHRRIQEQALAEAGVTPRRITEVGTADSMVALVAAGVGFSLVPWLHPGGPKVKGIWAFKQHRLDAQFPIRCAWSAAADQDPILRQAIETSPGPQ